MYVVRKTHTTTMVSVSDHRETPTNAVQERLPTQIHNVRNTHLFRETSWRLTIGTQLVRISSSVDEESTHFFVAYHEQIRFREGT
jgi:hypothetical protein